MKCLNSVMGVFSFILHVRPESIIKPHLAVGTAFEMWMRSLWWKEMEVWNMLAVWGYSQWWMMYATHTFFPKWLDFSPECIFWLSELTTVFLKAEELHSAISYSWLPCIFQLLSRDRWILVALYKYSQITMSENAVVSHQDDTWQSLYILDHIMLLLLL